MVEFSKQLICEVFQVDAEWLVGRAETLECFREVFEQVQKERVAEVLQIEKTLHFLFCLFCLVRSVKNKSTLNSMREFILNEVGTPSVASHLKELMKLTIHRLI